MLFHWPTTCQQDMFAIGLCKLVNKLLQCCSNNFSTRCLLGRIVASLLTSCDNAVPTTFQQDVLLCNRFAASLLTNCDNTLPTTCRQDLFGTGLHVASLLTSCDIVVPKTCQQDVFAICLLQAC
jgi:hypothetical protein